MKALVLSGGGSRGSYQIGVWKALRKLHIKIDIVTGTSIGALNGALIVQNSYLKALCLWHKIDMNCLFGSDIDMKKNTLKIYSDFLLSKKTIKTKKMEDIINKAINKKKFYNSKINYGLITVKANKLKPISLTKEKIKEDKLAAYLMASATFFPVFEKKNIEGDSYIDGGYFDNMPINLALKLGATSLITVDLKAIGFKRITKKNVPTIKIKPNNDLSYFLEFDSKRAKKNMKLGYNDTMKAYKKLEGNKFTFKKNETEKCFKEYKKLYEYFFNKILSNKEKEFYEKFILKNNKQEKFLKLMEQVALDIELDETVIYTYKKFNKKLLKKVHKLIKTNTLNKTIIMFEKMKEKKYNEVKRLALINPKIFLTGLYLYILDVE